MTQIKLTTSQDQLLKNNLKIFRLNESELLKRNEKTLTNYRSKLSNLIDFGITEINDADNAISFLIILKKWYQADKQKDDQIRDCENLIKILKTEIKKGK